jgi:hypothetical protein
MLKRVMVPLHRVKTPLMWGSSVLVVMIGLSPWSFDMRATFLMSKDRSEAPLMEDTSPERTDDSEHSLDAQTEPIIWGDQRHAQEGYPAAANSRGSPFREGMSGG